MTARHSPNTIGTYQDGNQAQKWGQVRAGVAAQMTSDWLPGSALELLQSTWLRCNAGPSCTSNGCSYGRRWQRLSLFLMPENGLEAFRQKYVSLTQLCCPKVTKGNQKVYKLVTVAEEDQRGERWGTVGLTQRARLNVKLCHLLDVCFGGKSFPYLRFISPSANGRNWTRMMSKGPYNTKDHVTQL